MLGALTLASPLVFAVAGRGKAAHMRLMAQKDSYHHGDLRAGLVEAARALVEHKGPDRMTMADACRAAGVSTAAPYRHFADKDALLIAVALEGLGRQHAAMVTALQGHAPGSDAAVAAMGLAYVRFAVAEPGVFRLMFGLTRSHRDHPALIGAGEATFGVLLAQLAQRLGQPADSPDVAARGFALWTFVHGLSFLLIDDKVEAMGLQVDIPALLADAARRFLSA